MSKRKIAKEKKKFYIKGKDIFIISLILIGICSVFVISHMNKSSKGISTLSSSVTDESGKMYISTPEELVAFSEKVNDGETFAGVHVML